MMFNAMSLENYYAWLLGLGVGIAAGSLLFCPVQLVREKLIIIGISIIVLTIIMRIVLLK